jgi:hypothetical protein
MAKLKDSNAPRVDQVIDKLVAGAPPLSDEAARRLAGVIATGKAKQ